MKKKQMIIGIVVLFVLIVGGFVVKMQMDAQARRDKEAVIEKIAKTYYEDYLYDVLTIGKDEKQLEEFFAPFKKEGLIVSLESVSKVSEIDVSKDMKKLGDSCNKKKNSITIQAEKPYGKKNYTLKVVCE